MQSKVLLSMSSLASSLPSFELDSLKPLVLLIKALALAVQLSYDLHEAQKRKAGLLLE